MVFFVDTNFFLQCKKYDQLNWSDITKNKDITILITQPVQREIDRLKNDGNTRRSKRARETTSLFRQILAKENFIFHTETPNYNITIKFAKQYTDKTLSQSNPNLNLAVNDDKILATLNQYLMENHANSESFTFLSNDTNPILTAKLNNLPVKIIPDSWLLDPETDDRDKEIQKLKQEVLKYQKKEPLIEVKFNTNDFIAATEEPNEFDVHIKIYDQIEQSDITKLVDSFIEKHPIQTHFDNNHYEHFGGLNKLAFAMQKYYPPDDDEIIKYNDAYQNWKSRLYELISDYAKIKNKNSHIVPFHLTIHNNGSMPADYLLLDINILTGGKLINPDFDDKVLKNRWAYPTPPKPPQGKWKNHMFFGIDRYMDTIPQLIPQDFFPSSKFLSHILANQRHDNNAFYWKGGKPEQDSVSWHFECNEFRHKLDGEQFSYYLLFDNENEKIVLQIRASASNMSAPFVKQYILNKTYTHLEAKNDILHLIENGVTEEVMKRTEGSKA